jgi:long-subunit fatty acid transport protein
MRKLLFFIFALCISGSLLAGGLVTNTNQSIMFTRLQSRNASTDVDAVYFNPAGVTKLGTGLHVSLNNQSIFQTKTVTNNYPTLSPNPKEYVGEISAPVYPGIYLAYNTGKFSFSAGFNPIGGGGGATYDNGLPSFEMPISEIAPGLSSAGIPTSQYDADIYFKGSSTFMGYQANLGYKINEMISVAAGIRIVSAKNTYNGYIKNIRINPNYPAFGASYTGGMVSAPQFFTDGQTYLNGVSTQLAGTASDLQPIITGGGGDVPLSSGTAVGMTPTQVATLEATITALGGDPTDMTIAESQAFFSGASSTYGYQAGVMGANAAGTQDRYVDVQETGSGYSPILSVNISPSNKLNIAAKYEFKTNLNLTTTVYDNKSGGIFVDGEKVVADMPAMLAIGVDYKPIPKLMLSGSMNYYFDKGVDYDGSDIPPHTPMIDKNFQEYALGIQYGLTEKLRISGGWLTTFTGVNDNYQTDLTFDLNTNTFGGGFGYHINSMIDLNIAGQYTFYKDGSKQYDRNGATVTETYDKQTWLIGLGLDFHFLAK